MIWKGCARSDAKGPHGGRKLCAGAGVAAAHLLALRSDVQGVDWKPPDGGQGKRQDARAALGPVVLVYRPIVLRLRLGSAGLGWWRPPLLGAGSAASKAHLQHGLAGGCQGGRQPLLHPGLMHQLQGCWREGAGCGGTQGHKRLR